MATTEMGWNKRKQTAAAQGGSAAVQPEEIELKGFNRTLAEIEWLLLILILVYLVIPGVDINALAISIACGAFALLIIGFRYLNLFTTEARWKLTVETLGMIALTAFVIWHTGKSDSPLVNLYLLPIVFSALTLGKYMALALVALITLLYLHASHSLLGDAFYTYETFSSLMFNFAPFVLVAYLTALLAADMNFARRFLQHLSETDDMTGLPNMRAFYAAMERERIRATRENTELTVMMIDTDNLKGINDELGHEVGNLLIIRMVETLKHTLRGSDLIARYGGDEFIVLLPNTGKAPAYEVAERIRKAIEHMTFDADGKRVNTTISIGFASYPEAAGDIQELISRADQAMYMSKKAGRNRVTAYGNGAEQGLG
ncbi:GGDEF domain-containing protein [Thioalkalivibrio paradoxus]|nr:diguanylate cyclase [Thioalkalivibrio paradoxus]